METKFTRGTDSRQSAGGHEGGDQERKARDTEAEQDRDLLPRDLRHHSMITVSAF